LVLAFGGFVLCLLDDEDGRLDLLKKASRRHGWPDAAAASARLREATTPLSQATSARLSDFSLVFGGLVPRNHRLGSSFVWKEIHKNLSIWEFSALRPRVCR